MSKRKKTLRTDTPIVTIESLTHEGKGVARVDGKVVFVDAVLPEEKVRIRYVHASRKHDNAVPEEIITPSLQRVTPQCEHFGLCGGCSMQHVLPGEQILLKQQILLDNLKHIGNVIPDHILPPLTGPVWGYRRKARLGVRDVIKKDKVLVGFREKYGRYLADLQQCHVLVPAVGMQLDALGHLIESLSIRAQVPQIEVAFGDESGALIFRVLAPPSDADQQHLITFGKENNLQIYIQPGGHDTITTLWPDTEIPLHYGLPDHGVSFHFSPTQFTQVNGDINRVMVNHALALLAPSVDDNVLELFCGLGNFTLPIAKHARHVTGIEGELGLVQLAQRNAADNGIANVSYHMANLFEDFREFSWSRQSYTKLFLDPPRTGAREVVEWLPWDVQKIVYVSCNPATLARDAAILVRDKGYKLTRAGVMDMFPHTSHVESIAEFVKK